MKILLVEFRVSSVEKDELLCDNQAAIHIDHNPIFHKRTKHIEWDSHYIQVKIKEALISLEHIK